MSNGNPRAARAARPRLRPNAVAPALSLLAIGLLAACGAPREAPGPTQAAAPASVPMAASPAALAARLPASAAGFQRGATVPVQRPHRGVEVHYATPGRTAAGFVQVLGAASDPAAVDAEFERSAAEVNEPASRRLTPTAEFVEPGGRPLFRCTGMEGRYGRQPMEGVVCVGSAGGQLLRVRVTMPRRSPAPADPRAFLREVSAALQSG